MMPGARVGQSGRSPHSHHSVPELLLDDTSLWDLELKQFLSSVFPFLYSHLCHRTTGCQWFDGSVTVRKGRGAGGQELACLGAGGCPHLHEVESFKGNVDFLGTISTHSQEEVQNCVSKKNGLQDQVCL